MVDWTARREGDTRRIGGSMARKRLTRAESKARTRAYLLEAAAELFKRYGFEGTSVEQIA